VDVVEPSCPPVRWSIWFGGVAVENLLQAERELKTVVNEIAILQRHFVAPLIPRLVYHEPAVASQVSNPKGTPRLARHASDREVRPGQPHVGRNPDVERSPRTHEEVSPPHDLRGQGHEAKVMQRAPSDNRRVRDQLDGGTLLWAVTEVCQGGLHSPSTSSAAVQRNRIADDRPA